MIDNSVEDFKEKTNEQTKVNNGTNKKEEDREEEKRVKGEEIEEIEKRRNIERKDNSTSEDDYAGENKNDEKSEECKKSEDCNESEDFQDSKESKELEDFKALEHSQDKKENSISSKEKSTSEKKINSKNIEEKCAQDEEKEEIKEEEEEIKEEEEEEIKEEKSMEILVKDISGANADVCGCASDTETKKEKGIYNKEKEIKQAEEKEVETQANVESRESEESEEKKEQKEEQKSSDFLFDAGEENEFSFSAEQFFNNDISDFQKAEEQTNETSEAPLIRAYNEIKKEEDIFLSLFKNMSEKEENKKKEKQEENTNFPLITEKEHEKVENVDFSNVDHIYRFLKKEDISNLTNLSDIRQGLNENLNILIKEQKKTNKKIKINKSYCNIHSYLNTLYANPNKHTLKELQKGIEFPML